MAKKEYGYGEQFAARYLRSLQYSYTIAKNALLANETMTYTPDGGVVLDIGGNVNALLKGNSMRYRLETLQDTFDKKVDYYVMDVSQAYFNIGGTLDSTLEQLGVEWYRNEIPGIIGDIQTSDYPSETVDTVIMADTLEHIDNPDIALNNVHRILKPNGNLQLVLPTMYMLDQFPERAKDRKKRTSHVNFFNNESITSLLNESGFGIEDIKGLDYVSGFLYLLYTNNNYIMRRNPKTGKLAKKEAMRFKDLQTTIRSSQINTLEIDNLLNDPTYFNTFMSAVNEGVAHPLTIIHEAIKLDPSFETSQNLQELYEYLRQNVLEIQKDFDSTELLDLLNSVPHNFTANSVYVRASKMNI